MIRAAASYFAAVPTVWIDGTLYVCIALLTFVNGYIGTDEAAKYIAPAALFWGKFAVGSLSASALAVKLFRSTAFADHQAEKSAQVPSAQPKDSTTPVP
jgi:hypothetical protein